MNVINEIFAIRKRVKRVQIPPPTSALLNITGNCNLRCEFCEKRNGHNKEEIGFNDLKAILDVVHQNGMSVFFSGGEPFLYTRIWDALDYCKTIGQKIFIVTNATLLGRLKSWQQDLLNEQVEMMSISIESPDKAENDRIRGVPGTFDRVMAYVSNPKRSHPVGICTVIAADMSNIIPMIDFAAETGLPINFQPLILASNFPYMEKLAWKEDVRAKLPAMADEAADFIKYYRYAQSRDVITNLSMINIFAEKFFRQEIDGSSFFEDMLPDFFCFIPLNNLIINEFGEIMPCVFMRGDQYITDGHIEDKWRTMASDFRQDWLKGQRWRACKDCACHFPENLRSNIIAFPMANYKYLTWFASYYLTRLASGVRRR